MKNLLTALTRPREYEWGLRPWRRHSLVVLVAGFAYIAIGATYLLTEPVESRESALALALNLAPMSAWGVVWIAVGVLAVISARWPPASETWGYATLSGLAAWWSACYALGVALGAENQSMSGALIWGLVAFLWWAIAGLWNPDHTLVRLSPADHDSLAPPHRDAEGG